MPAGGILGAIAQRVNPPLRVDVNQGCSPRAKTATKAPAVTLHRQATTLPLHLRHLEHGTCRTLPPPRGPAGKLSHQPTRGAMGHGGPQRQRVSLEDGPSKVTNAKAFEARVAQEQTEFGTTSRGHAVQIHKSDLEMSEGGVLREDKPLGEDAHVAEQEQQQYVKQRTVCLPYSRGRAAWDVLVSIIVFYTALTVPVAVAFTDALDGMPQLILNFEIVIVRRQIEPGTSTRACRCA